MIRRQAMIMVMLATIITTGGCAAGVEQQPIAFRSSAVIPGSGIFVSSLALDSAGVPHIAFVSGDEARELRYRVGDGTIETVADIGESGQMEFSLDLALASDRRAGIVFERAGRLFYSERYATGWSIERVDESMGIGYFAALDYDRNGQPHISYFDQRDNDIKYATHTARGWLIETIDASGQPGFHIPAGFTRIAIGCRARHVPCAEPRPQVVYLAYRYKPYDGELRYAIRLDRGWQITTIDSDRGAGGFVSLALDAEGYPWVSYYRASTWDFAWGELRLAHLDKYGWRIDTLDQGSYVGRYNAVALDPAGQPLVAYYVAPEDALRIMWWRDGWHRATVDPHSGSWVTLAVDAASTAHLTYVDRTARDTRYATFRLPHN